MGGGFVVTAIERVFAVSRGGPWFVTTQLFSATCSIYFALSLVNSLTPIFHLVHDI